jgi:hypothetical protein
VSYKQFKTREIILVYFLLIRIGIEITEKAKMEIRA